MATGYDSSSHLLQNTGAGRLRDSRTIEVRNFNPTTSDETFETFFENKRRSGGGDIEKIDGDDRETGIIRVTFVEPEVAEHVLTRSDLMLDGAQLQLSPLQPPEQLIWDRKTIEVHGLNPSSSQDAIELFFESKRRSGGDAVEDVYLDTDSNVAVVTFQEPEVAERVLQMPTLVLNEATLTVRPKEHISSEHSTTDDTDYQRNEDPATAERAEIQSVSSGISFECFEDEKQDQSRSDDDIATLGDSGENTHGTPLEPETPPGLQHHKEHTQPDGASDAARPSLQILRIHGFTPTTSKEAVEMFLVNKSGEIDLESCAYDIGAGVAIVAFKNPQGAAKLMSLEQLTLGGAQLSITPLRDAYAGLDVEATRPRAVRVCGIPRDTSREFLLLFFDNRRMSGGGDIEELEYNDDQRVAIITYIDPESARSVVEKQPLKVNNTEVQVTLMMPQQALPVVSGPVEESTVLVTGLSAACTSDDLKKFFTKTSLHNEIQHITFSQRPGVAMITFSSPPDFDSLRVLCLMRPLRDTMLSVHRVPISHVVQVQNIGSVSQDMLTLYFDSKKHSGGGKVVHVTVHREHNYALIEVEDSAIVHDILARGCHKLDDQSLHVTVYYEDLGLIFPCHDALTSAEPIADKIMVSGFNPDILNFVHRSPTCRHIVDNMMAEVAADVGWDTYSDPSMELTCVTGNWKKIAHTFDTDWKQTVKDTFLGLLQNVFASEDVHIPNEIWMDFLEHIRYVDNLDSNRIVVEVKDQECRVSVVGLTDEVDNILRRLNGNRAKLQPGTSQTATVRNLKEHQLMMLSATGFKGKMQKQFPDLKVDIDYRAQSVCFTGMPKSIASAKADMSATFKIMTSTQMDMSAALIKVITGNFMMKYVVQGFKRMNIRAVFQAVGNKKLGVWALNKEHLTIAGKVIESCVAVKKIVADMTSIQSAWKWKVLLDRVKFDHGGLLEVTETEDGITVSGAVKPVELAAKFIHDFLVQQIIDEKFVNMKHGIVNYMAKYMKKEVNDVRIAFRDDNIKVTPKTDGPCGFAVKGRKTGLDGAVRQLWALADRVKVDRCNVDKPGALAFLSSGDGKRAIGHLQEQHKVVIDPVVTGPRDYASHAGWRAGNSKVLSSKHGDSKVLSSKHGDGKELSSITLPCGVTVEVVQGNLTRFHADAIVNTANEQLDHVGGLAKAIVTAGGQQIQKQCHAYVREHGKLQPSQVFVSTPGKLPCKELIHTVGPVWRGGESDKVNALGDAISASMTKAEQLGLSSIAFPALSSGVYGFPLDTCTLTIVAALRDFFENHKRTCVRKVSLLDRSEEITKSFERSLVIIFGSCLAMPSDDTSAGDDTAQRNVNPPIPGAASDSSDIVVQTQEGITLSLCKSEMAQMKVDAIVNSTDCGLHLDHGGLSLALLQHGGATLQLECQLAAPDGIEYGEVVTTSGGQLNCQLVVHGACCPWDGGDGRSEQVLRTFVANSFKVAHVHKLSSIALPAIGTGIHGFPPDIVAEVMLDELRKFSSGNSQTHLRDVRFVMYEKNVHTTQAFEKTLRSCGLHQAIPRGVQQPACARSDGAMASLPSAKTLRKRSRSRSVSRTRGSANQQQQQRSISGTFDIFGRTPAAIARAVKALKQMCNKECAVIVLNKKSDMTAIAKLTNRQMSQIRSLEDKLGVKIDITKTPSDQRIVIRGAAANTSQAHAEILQIFIDVVVADGKERVASVISKQFQWRYAEGGVFKNYPPTTNCQLEIAYQDKKDSFQWKDEDTGGVFLVLFDSMIERSTTRHSSVDVERCVIGDGTDLPANWSSMGNTEHVKLEELQPTSREFQSVKDKFMSSPQGTVRAIIKIERVQNPGLYRQYMLRKEEMKKRKRQPAVIERSLWHGTSADAVQNINMGGFNRSYCGKNATAYGNGVYFAMSSEYSTRDTYATPDLHGVKRVYMSLVLTGDYTNGQSAYRVPPDNPSVPGLKYDTVVNNVNSPDIFVVFLDNQAYPEYLITLL